MEHNGHEYVDFGLPSGLKWATCNVGASTPTEYGDYFMWGSTTPNTNDDYDWENTPFNNGSSAFNEDYFNSVKDTICPNDVLALEYDAAHENMGGDWRMPTLTELFELIDNTNHDWVTDYQGSSINGVLLTSKVDSRKSIFIPSSGYRDGVSAFGQGKDAYLWSRSIKKNYDDNAWYLYLYSTNCGVNYCGRYDGMCLRGVF